MNEIDKVVLDEIESLNKNSNGKLIDIKNRLNTISNNQGLQLELFQATTNFLPPNDQTLSGHLLAFIYDKNTDTSKWRNVTLNQNIPTPTIGYYVKFLPLNAAVSTNQGFNYKTYTAKNTTVEFNSGHDLIKIVNIITNSVQWVNGTTGIKLLTPPQVTDYYDKLDSIFKVSNELIDSGIAEVTTTLNAVGDSTNSFIPIPGRPFEIYIDAVNQNTTTPTILQVYYNTTYRNDLYNDLPDTVEVNTDYTRRVMDPVLTYSQVSLKLITLNGPTSVMVKFKQ